MTLIAFYIYKYIFAPTIYGLVQILKPFLSQKLQEIANDKNSRHAFLKNPGQEKFMAQARPFWIHAASGEIEYARPVIREIKRRNPEIPILVTYSSPSAKKILSAIDEVDIWTSMPWELAGHVQEFINTWTPRSLLFARTDVWPVVADVARTNKIPMVLFSATFAENSSRLSLLSLPLTKFTLSQLAEIHCVAPEDLLNLEPLKLKTPCYITGDTRFDQVFHRLSNPKSLRNELMPSPDEIIFIAGSTWPEDEKVIIPALAKFKGQKIRTIIAPHETSKEHLKDLENQLKAEGLNHIRYSEARNWIEDTVLIIDQVGILAELYTWADVAFVGGSFKKQVHSVMEPLAAGLPVLVGPHHKNNREALFYQKKSYSSGMIVQVIHSSEDIVVLLGRQIKNQVFGPQIKEEIQREMAKNKDSTQKLLLSIEKVLR